MRNKILLVFLAILTACAPMSAAPQLVAVQAVYNQVNPPTVTPEPTLTPTPTLTSTPTPTSTPTVIPKNAVAQLFGFAYRDGASVYINLIAIEIKTGNPTIRLTRLVVNGKAQIMPVGQVYYNQPITREAQKFSVLIGYPSVCRADIDLSSIQSKMSFWCYAE